MAGVSPGGVRAGGAFFEIFAKDGQFQQAMTRIQNRLKAVGTAMRQIGTNMAIGGTALGLPFVVAAREAANFTLAMAQVKANTGATEAEFEKLNKAARQLGVQMGQSPTEVATAMSELAKAGLDAQGVMGGIGPVLALAAADNMELARAVEVVVSTMAQFSLSTSEFSSIADRLQAAANASTTSVDLIGESLSYVGPQAQAAGQSLDDVLAAMGALAQGGIRGSMAGTQLARVLTVMAAEEGKINALGVSVRDAQGNLRPFMDVIRDLGQATSDMTTTDRVQKFMEIFDDRGARAALALSNLDGEFRRILGTIQNSSGAAASKAEQVLGSFGGAVRRLAAQFADLKIAVITSMGSSATAAVQGLGRLLSIITKLIENNPTLVATVAAVAGGLFGLGAAMIAGGIAMQVMSKGVGVFLAGLRMIPALLSPIGLIGVTIAAGVAGGIAIARTLSPAFRSETDAIMAAISQMDFATAWQIMNLNFAIALTQMTAKVSEFVSMISGAFQSAGSFIGDMLLQGLDRFMGLFGADIITIQSALQKLGVYFRAAFDWDFAFNGMDAALKAVDKAADQARGRSPTADARAEERAAGRQRAADGRQRQMDENRKFYEDVVNELRSDLQRTKDKLNPKKEEKAPPGAVVQPADRGVMPIGAGAGAGNDGGGFGKSAGSFASGEGLGISSELNKLEDPARQTAANTAVAAQALQQMAGAKGLDGQPIDLKAAMAESESELAATAAAAGVNAAAAPMAGSAVASTPAAKNAEVRSVDATAGVAATSEMLRLADVCSQGFKSLIEVATEHKNLTASGNKTLQSIDKHLANFGEEFV